MLFCWFTIRNGLSGGGLRLCLLSWPLISVNEKEGGGGGREGDKKEGGRRLVDKSEGRKKFKLER